MKKNALLAVLMLPFLSSTAQLPDPRGIMSQCRDKSLAGSMTATVNLTITEKNGSVRSRTISLATKTYPGDVEKRFIRFLAPPDVRGTSMLVIDNKDADDDMWIYLPALKRTRRIVSAEKGRSFMSSEFSNADMSSPSLNDFTDSHADGSGNGNRWIIVSIPVSEDKADEYGYSKKISYIEKNSLVVKKMEFYNFRNELFKTIEIKKIFPLDKGKYIVSDMEANNLRTGRRSEIVNSDILTGDNVSDNLFTLQNLER